ncbi:MAG: [FeFe] hydrogenase H-cluster radical SAM maturase HydE, partial [Acholeplasmatales bacterium]|nr:[FeFe] hydrogenase H-cluster radical SAM maturase HydE [Acholeplasmatales bacterium]
SYQNRIRCIKNLKELGYQVGIGFMVGSPYQSDEMLAKEMVFLKKLNPAMVGIGPYISHKDTPFSNMNSGSAELTTFLLSLIRLTLPGVLLPATTALATIDNKGREKGILAGANVLMPNLSPLGVRKKYLLYDNKICLGDEAASCIRCLDKKISKIDRKIVTDRGDYALLNREIERD